jgi:predicted AAA+ superfamily ATPase
MALRPWRDTIQPHPDVASGRYRQAEFAADLEQVRTGKAEAEYQDAAEFYRRTYLTPGMVHLISGAIERLTARGGDPAVQLETAFGGGKTHSMLALYHAFGGKAKAADLLGISDILKAAGVDELPVARMAVLVGTALSPSKPRKHKALGKQQARTLWGEMAVQIGGAEGYELVRAADESGTAPGQELDELFARFGPCLILIDELVAYARNIYGVSGLPGGSFDSNLTFVQNLTEAVRRSGTSVVVGTIPASDIEIGGEGGKAALERIQHTFDRLSVPRASVEAEEGFEIVRRRLFSPDCDEDAKEATCSAFSQMYAQSSGDFPQQSREGAYLERLRRAFPIHPELFDRLYDDWSMLERFQKVRGVLRLLAAAIHELWVRGDQSYLILPGTLPLDAARVRDELTRYLPEGWNGVVDSDVDGERSEPRTVDEANPRLGGVMAARRVARTIFLGSAPSVREQRVRGIEDVRVRLGAVQPGESVAVFNDALAALNNKLTHLYTDNFRYWYDLPPNLRRTVEDRASRLDWERDILPELERRLRAVRDRGDFRAVHVCPTSADVPDEQATRLVVLSPASGHKANQSDSKALAAANEILEKRGTGLRQYRNMLVFVAPDRDAMISVEQETRRYLAWKSVAEDEGLDLSTQQRKQANEQTKRSDETVDVRIRDAYRWLMVPTQEVEPGKGPKPLTIEIVPMPGTNESHVVRASKKLRGAEQLITKWSPALLRMELDRWMWKDADHVGLAQVWDYLCRYCYLPRLQDSDVLLEAVGEGIKARDHFGYAGRVGESGKYLGLQIGGTASVYLDNQSVLVKPEVALKQKEAEAAAAGEAAGAAAGAAGVPIGAGTPGRTTEEGDSGVAVSVTPVLRRFHGSVQVDATRLSRDAGRIAEEVVQHLAGLVGADVKVTLEIEAEIPDGASDNVVRTVTENCRTLGFTTQGFEEG